MVESPIIRKAIKKHCRSQIKTPLRYLFVTMPENATNGYEWRNKALRYSELSTTHAKNSVTEKDCAVPPVLRTNTGLFTN